MDIDPKLLSAYIKTHGLPLHTKVKHEFDGAFDTEGRLVFYTNMWIFSAIDLDGQEEISVTEAEEIIRDTLKAEYLDMKKKLPIYEEVMKEIIK